MTSRIAPLRHRSHSAASLLCAPVAAAFLLGGCGNGESVNTTQAVAKVGKQEITELQVNQMLERQTGLKPEQVEPARRKVIASLVDQQILVDKSQQLKLDREQPVVQAIEAAKRDIIARAYLERVAAGVPKPTADAVRAYYQDQPALFKERRVYTFQDLNITATPEQRADIESQLKTLKSPSELEAYVKSRQIPVRGERSTVAAENVPLALLDKVSKMKPGQGIVLPTPAGIRIMLIASVEDAPVSEEQARPAIEAFLLNDQKRRTLEQEMGSLRAATKVEYLGKFADMAASAAAGAASVPDTPTTASLPSMAASAAPGASGPAGLDAKTLSNALSGIK